MSELEKMKKLLRKAKFLRKGGDPVEALTNLIFELEQVGKDHGRIECLSHMVKDFDYVTIMKTNHPTRVRKKVSVFTHGKQTRGFSVSDALDRAHKAHHGKRWVKSKTR